MAAEWYYTTNKQQMGPVSWSELRELADLGILKASDMVWTDGMDEWVKVENQAGLLTDDSYATITRPLAKPSRAEVESPSSRRERVAEVDDEQDDEEREKPKKSRRRGDNAGMSSGLKVMLILAAGGLFLFLGAACIGGIIWVGVRGAAVGGSKNYTVSNLRAMTVDDHRFQFTAGKRVVITSTNQTQFPLTDVDLRVFRGNVNVPNEFPIAFDDRLPQRDPHCRVQFVVPATDTYRVRVANLGPGTAISCRVVIEEQ